MALFFSQRKPRGFNYTPRYYNPEADEREERKRIVLGVKYRSPKELAREAAEAEARAAGVSADGSAHEAAAATIDPSGRGSARGAADDYVPGAFLREHVAARRGSAHAFDAMRKRRKKTRSVPMLLAILVIIGLVGYILYFK
ncbi:MAG: hypothetical protein LBV18_06890 [Alistipes sp.]|jgi:hypothetical protein|nr:hypothetical protein [Alistipes sp.]